jgi:hypothetical protein
MVTTQLKSASRILIVYAAFFFCSTSQARFIYVDTDAVGANNGSSWENAYNFLQDALADANSSRKPVEIRVAQGTYTPDSNSARPDGSGDRQATFELINGVALKGGYAGFGEPNPDARDVQFYETVLSGDLQRNDDGLNNISENSFRVVTVIGAGSTAVLDGFIVTASTGGHPAECAGLYNYLASPTVSNCTFFGNRALSSYSGNSVLNRYGHPTISNCFFDGDGQNIGVLSETGSLIITNCIFARNSQCGIESFGSEITVTNSLFSENEVAIFVDYCHPIIKNCTFYRNDSVIKYDGGASATFTNCIAWENSFYADSVSYSCIYDYDGGGIGIIEVNPLFVDPYNGDYRLRPDSPCIDTGDPNYVAAPGETDLDGKARIIGGRIDMGAFEFGDQVRADVRIVPRSINLSSGGKWITCFIWLPEDHSVQDIEAESILLENQVKPISVRIDEQLQAFIGRFSRRQVQAVLEPGDFELTVSGELTGEIMFQGTDIVKVIE